MIQFPCPVCRQSREELNATCQNCGWNPDGPAEPAAVSREVGPSMDTVIFVGFLTALPICYIVLFLLLFVGNLLFLFGRGPGFFQVIFLIHTLDILLTFALIAYYIHFLFKTDRVPADKKALWAVVLFLGNAIAMPIFWYHYLWVPMRQAEKS